MCGLKWKCDKLPSLVSDAEAATINTAPIMHICVSVLWTSVYLWRFDDNKKALLFPTTLLCIRISFSDKLGLKFTVSQQFTSNFFKLQVLHLIFKQFAFFSPFYTGKFWLSPVLSVGLRGAFSPTDSTGLSLARFLFTLVFAQVG